MHRLFVYGTLRKTGSWHDVYMKEAVYIGNATLPPKYTMYSTGFFPMVMVGGCSPIKGELYDVTEEKMKEIEGLEAGYQRVKVLTTDNKEVDMFVMSDENIGRVNERYRLDIIKTGDWFNRAY